MAAASFIFCLLRLNCKTRGGIYGLDENRKHNLRAGLKRFKVEFHNSTHGKMYIFDLLVDDKSVEHKTNLI